MNNYVDKPFVFENYLATKSAITSNTDTDTQYQLVVEERGEFGSGTNVFTVADVFNETHAQVIVGGKHRIMRQVPAEIQPETRYSYECIALKELKLMYENEQIQVGGKKIGDQISPIFNDKMTAWSSNQNCKKYTGGVVFSPAKTLGSDYYNMWRGFAVEPQDNAADTTLVTQHIEQIICDNIKWFSVFF